MAANTRPLSDPRVRSHAPADPGCPRDRVLAPLSRRLPHGASPRRRRPGPGPRGLARARVLSARREPAARCPCGRRPARWPDSRHRYYAADAPGHRCVHSRRGRELRLRAERTRRRHQCGASATPGFSPEKPVRGQRRAPSMADCSGTRATRRSGSVGHESGADGTGSVDLYGAGGEVWGVPGAGELQDRTKSGQPVSSAPWKVDPASDQRRPAVHRCACSIADTRIRTPRSVGFGFELRPDIPAASRPSYLPS